MIRADRVIISAAVTGSVHVPSQSDHLPLSPEQVVRSSLEAAQAGAAIIHLHARHPDGRPAFEPATFEEIIPPIVEQCDAVVNITTGGASSMTIEERLAAAARFSPELASLNMGSMNFVYSGIAERVSRWKHDWEKPYVENTYRQPFINTFAQIEYTLREIGDKGGTRFEYECYDIGHLYTLAHFVDRGLARPPLFIQGVFGILGGIGADHANLTHMIAIADKLFGTEYHFSAFAAGRHQMQFCTHSAWLGGHVRVGLEDNLYIGKGDLATSNAQQVHKVRSVVEDLGRTIATPDEARAILGLKGGRNISR
ncbi:MULTISPECIES: 3-keto-5-aminohexanoate cleavage protein [unclassified Micromonospora]|uniref:3-keto-5-aminohexanoate cleavage protein n=1 Tax=unclassified Micromonospora TaxID=2617518 RepID=UPI001B37AC76|nr:MULTISPECIES: 3-keto-5-aminohexanoate cleavage protein [unclassified Micromonospora]MBQ1046320.1 3-keto-5-aminohexanoate cleavage protein [Micromonospora sp. C72]MBQ1058849.1 3-keto-5-aminohexanoate cleavage protein [Micromonospora sp. C32]